VFHISNNERVRSCLFAGGAIVRVTPLKEGAIPATHLLVKPLSAIWLVMYDDVYKQFTCVDRSAQPCALTAFALAVMTSVSRPPFAFAGGLQLSLRLRTSELLPMHAQVGYC
jgi:hypothetical protein